MRADQTPNLTIRFHGRVIEHLGIEMYQSPVAAIAELVSNAWDAEASKVQITLPSSMSPEAEILIEDDGDGMTFADCQERFLQVGYNRRKEPGSERTRSGRPVMGRKGIGKFAGFGIAQIVEITTVSRETGELTEFVLDANRLLEGGESSSYADNTPMEVEVVRYLGPDVARKSEHGTTVALQSLTFQNRPSRSVFRRGMSRRFLLLERAEDFSITVDDEPLPDTFDSADVEFDFPASFGEESPDGVEHDGPWAVEKLATGRTVRWRIQFFKTPISDEDLAGVAIYAHHKLAQRPFTFQLGGGIGAQQGIPYLSGVVEADFIDDLPKDLISTERQRINWAHSETSPLLTWGQVRLQSLLREWQSRRSAGKLRAIRQRIAGFSGRLEKLPKQERKVVTRAIEALARISTLTSDQFDDLANAILTAWEGGRLHDLIGELADADELDSDDLVNLLAESQVITALHAAERVRGQLNLILSLEDRLKKRELENAVRDFISENPWLIKPEWETFRKEVGVNHLIREAADEVGLTTDSGWNARIDLCLASGNKLLVLEFMRPGLTIDWDHLNRFEQYVLVLREKVAANAGSRFNEVDGILVADHIERRPAMRTKIASLRSDKMDVADWTTLLATARSQWIEYFDILFARAPEDERMQILEEVERSIPRGN